MGKKKRTALATTAICIGSGIALVITCAVIGIWGILIDKDCLGYLKRAADANTVELAQGELDKALAYLDQHNLKSGYTSVVYNTPDEDLGFWYQNILTAKMELAAICANDAATPLEKSNVLMKLRETLLDGKTLTRPSGLSRFPHNTSMALIQLLLAFVFIGTGGWKFTKYLV